LPVLQTGRPVEEAKALERAGVLRYFVRIASTLAPFPHSAHRTGHADFPHPAFGQDITPFRV
jgi:hypothetical protein